MKFLTIAALLGTSQAHLTLEESVDLSVGFFDGFHHKNIGDAIEAAYAAAEDKTLPPVCGSEILNNIVQETEAIYDGYANSPCQKHKILSGLFKRHQPNCPSFFHPHKSMEYLDDTGILPNMRSLVDNIFAFNHQCQ